jgi:hypothetical protein
MREYLADANLFHGQTRGERAVMKCFITTEQPFSIMAESFVAHSKPDFLR